MFAALFLTAVTVSLRGFDVLIVPFAFIVAIGVIIITPLALFRRWYFYRRRLKKHVITAQYESPLDLTPAELGYLFDGRLRDREVGATIIHLLQRGLLHTKKTEDGNRIFSGPRIDDHLRSYEKKLIEESDVEEGIKGEDLLSRFIGIHTQDFNIPVATKTHVFTLLVHDDLQKKSYVKNRSLLAFLWGSWRISAFLCFVILYVPLVLLWGYQTLQSGTVDLVQLGMVLVLATIISSVFFLPFLIVGMILNYYRGSIVGREWMITPKLERLWPQIVGYRQYVQLVEADRLDFDNERLKKISRNDALSYAIALGFVKNWRKMLS